MSRDQVGRLRLKDVAEVVDACTRPILLHQSRENGIRTLRPELFRTGHGGVLTRDAGYIVLHQTFDGKGFISSELFVDR